MLENDTPTPAPIGPEQSPAQPAVPPVETTPPPSPEQPPQGPPPLETPTPQPGEMVAPDHPTEPQPAPAPERSAQLETPITPALPSTEPSAVDLRRDADALREHGEHEKADYSDRLASLANQHEAATSPAEALQSADTPAPIANETFPMAVNVKPLEKVEHTPGVNASEGDPPHVDPNSPTTEHDITTAFKKANAGGYLRSEAAELRDSASKYSEIATRPELIEGKDFALEEAESKRSQARNADEMAQKAEENAGLQPGAEHGAESKNRNKKFEELIKGLKDHVQEMQRLIEELERGQASDKQAETTGAARLGTPQATSQGGSEFYGSDQGVGY